MKQHEFNQAAGIVFLAIGLAHLFRLVQGWEAVINGWVVPIWLSWIAVFLALYLAFHAITLLHRRQP